MKKTLAVGSYGDIQNFVKGHAHSEWFDSSDGTWTSLTDSPVGQFYSDFVISAVDDAFFLFGGYAYNLGYADSKVVSRFKGMKNYNEF